MLVEVVVAMLEMLMPLLWMVVAAMTARMSLVVVSDVSGG